MRLIRTQAGLFIACSVALFGSVNSRAEEQIRSYTVPKGTAEIPVNAAPVQWTLPEGWQQLPPDGVRIGNFTVTGKDGGQAAVAITSFPGEVGTELANVNRWRGQLELAPVEENEIVSTPVSVDSADGKLYDISSSTGRMVVALIRRGGATWFFKMTGDLGVVNDAKPTFLDFLKSIHFTAPGDSASTIPPTPSSSAPPATATDAGASGDAAPKWKVPANWTEKAPSAMLFKSFFIAWKNDASATVTVSFFSGAMGGVLANVNRWRGQVGLAPVGEEQLDSMASKVDTDGGQATMVDFEGSDAKAGERLVAFIVPRGDNTWFYKLLGDAAVVGKEKDNFVNFVKSVQYP